LLSIGYELFFSVSFDSVTSCVFLLLFVHLLMHVLSCCMWEINIDVYSGCKLKQVILFPNPALSVVRNFNNAWQNNPIHNYILQFPSPSYFIPILFIIILKSKKNKLHHHIITFFTFPLRGFLSLKDIQH